MRTDAQQIIHLPPALRPQCVLSVPVAGATAVAWAPLLGRVQHRLAVGARDGRVRIFKLSAPGHGHGEQWASECVADFDEHASVVSRVEWNLTGCVPTPSLGKADGAQDGARVLGLRRPRAAVEGVVLEHLASNGVRHCRGQDG